MPPRDPVPSPAGRIELHDGWIDLQARRVHRQPPARLTPIETRLLGFLAARSGQPCTREQLLEQVWGYHPDSRSRAVEATVLRLRRKLEVDPAEPAHLQTVWGVGFRFVPPVRPAAPGERPYVGHAGLLERLVATEGALLLVGPGGIGKSRMAEQVLRRRRGAFCELAACKTPLEALLQIGWTLGIETHPDPSRTTERLAAAMPERGLVVLDNLEQIDGFEPTLRAFAAAPGVCLLGTSRHGVEGLPQLEVPPLSAEESRALLQALVPEPLGPCEGLVERTGGMPLAIELAARQLDVLTDREALAGPRARASLQEGLARSLDRLPPPMRLAYGRLAALPPLELPVEVAQAVLGEDAVEGLRTLVARSLLTRRSVDGRTWVRIPTALHPGAGAGPGAGDAEVFEVAALAWLARNEPVLERLERGDGRAEDELAADSSLGLALIDAALTPATRARLLACLLSRLHAQGQLASAWARVEALLRCPLPPALADRVRQMGAATLLRMGRPSTALELLADPAVDGAEARRRRRHLRAGALRALGRVVEALALLDEELAGEELTGVQRGAIHHARALCLASLDRLEEAYDAAMRARTMLEGGPLHDRLAAHNTLGTLALRLGRDATARVWLEAALPLAEAHGRHTLGVVRTNLANLLICAGALDAAEVQLRAGLADHRWSGRVRGAGIATHHLGRLELLRGRYAAALVELSSAQVLLERCDATQLVTWTRCFAAIASAELGDVVGAEATLDAVGDAGELGQLADAHLQRARGRAGEPPPLDACSPELRPHAEAFGGAGR